MSTPTPEIVIREVTKGVWTFSRPFDRFGFWPIGGRSTAIQLQNGGVWVLASTPLDARTKTKLEELGPVKYIIGPDASHNLFLSDFKKHYPEAKLILPEAAIGRIGDKDLKVDGAWGRDPPDTKYGFEDEIDWCYFSGYKIKDVAFLHKPSKSLIEADLLLNVASVKEQYSNTKQPSNFLGLGAIGPSSWIHAQLAWSLGKNAEEMRRDAKTVSNWDFTRIIPCHGDVIETDAKKAWNNVFRHFLN